MTWLVTAMYLAPVAAWAALALAIVYGALRFLVELVRSRP